MCTAPPRHEPSGACWRVAVGVDLMNHNTGAIVRNPVFDLIKNDFKRA